MKNILSLVFLLSTILAHAQHDPCADSLLAIKGSWKFNKNPVTSSAANYAAEKKFADAVHAMFYKNYSPAGLDLDYSMSFVAARDQSFDTYSYQFLALTYMCSDNGKFVKNHEGNTSLRVSFNSFGEAEIYDTSTDHQLEGFFDLRHGLPVEKKPGIWYFPEDPESLGFGRTGKSNLWLMTYDGKLPWNYVTKKEFLEKRKRNLQILMAESEASTKSTIANIEKGKKFKEEEYKDDPEKMQKYLRVDYNPMMERYKGFLKDNNKPYEAAIKKIDDQLQQSETELNQIAIVKSDPKSYLDYLFTDAKDPMGKILIRPNPGYFKKLPNYVPQMIQVELIYDHENILCTKLNNEVTKVLDLDYLKSFIGKSAPGPVPTP